MNVVLPELGENIEIADVSAVLVAVGDDIRADQPLIEVETEKASLEVPAEIEGRVTELRVRTGDQVKVGQVILVIEPVTTAQAAEPPPPPSKPKIVADLGPEPAEASKPA